MILTTALLIRWIISILVICILLIGFFVLLKYLKQKQLLSSFENVSDKKLKVLEKVYIDSKNKIIKLQDGNKVFTILLGDSNLLINEEKKNEDS